MLVTAPGSADQSDGAFDFAHELVRQVAYDAVLGPDRIALHSRILAALEAAQENDLTADLAGALAHHALSAQNWAKAADYAAAIARRSFSQSALPDATRHYERAMQALDRLPPSLAREAKAIDLRIEARSAYANLGKVTHWLDLAKEAEARSAAIGDDMRRVAALAVRAAALDFCGMPADALTTGAEAVDQARRCGNPGWLAYARAVWPGPGVLRRRTLSGSDRAFRAGAQALRSRRRDASHGRQRRPGWSAVLHDGLPFARCTWETTGCRGNAAARR